MDVYRHHVRQVQTRQLPHLRHFSLTKNAPVTGRFFNRLQKLPDYRQAHRDIIDRQRNHPLPPTLTICPAPA